MCVCVCVTRRGDAYLINRKSSIVYKNSSDWPQPVGVLSGGRLQVRGAALHCVFLAHGYDTINATSPIQAACICVCVCVCVCVYTAQEDAPSR